MASRAFRLAAALSVCLFALVSAVLGDVSSQVSLVDQGWRVVEQSGERVVEMSVLVVNDGQTSLDQYEVLFILESSSLEQPGQSKAATPASAPRWTVVRAVSVKGGPVAGDASVVVKATIPYSYLATGKAYRFRAELYGRSRDPILATIPLTSQAGAATGAVGGLASHAGLAAGAALAVAGRSALLTEDGGSSGGAAGSGSPHAPGERGGYGNTASGTGTMVGTHTARRVGAEWVEQGSGTMKVYTTHGYMQLSYTYTARGPSAANLTATATATGTLVQKNGKKAPVTITSSSAQMTAAGSRTQVGQLVTRLGSTATGTFSGTVDKKQWTGLLTMTAGRQTLNLNTNAGSHQFDIQFTASR